MKSPTLALRSLLTVLLLLLPLCATAVITNPNPQRAFVSRTGLDTNPCTAAAPCRTWSVALTQTENNGEVVTLDSGDFYPFSINQGASLVVPDGIDGAMSSAAAAGITIDAPGQNVIVRGVTLQGRGGAVGINVIAAASVVIEHCKISNFTGYGIFITGPKVGFVVVRDTQLNFNGSGIRIQDSNHVQISRTSIEGGYWGLFATYFTGSSGPMRISIDHLNLSGPFTYGVTLDMSPAAAGTAGRMNIQDSVIDGGSWSGAQVVASGSVDARMTLTNTTFEHNLIALESEILYAGGTAQAVVKDCQFIANTYAITSSGGGALGTGGNNFFSGNFLDVYGTLNPFHVQ